jgi:transaldolase
MPEAGINRLKKLYQLGQSPWYDNIDRRLIENGELKSLFDSGIVGVTSNPTIFEKAVNSSAVYDEKIKRLKKEGRTLEQIYDELTADDVRDAADMLKKVFEETRGGDGYVSIEVLPEYAFDTAKTIEYARHIFKKVGRPNIMVKVPGTKESPEAIRTLIREGINVNVTLLFSGPQYELVAGAYLDGLRDRLKDGLDVRSVASVASVFISRIDTKVDNLLEVFASRTHDIDVKARINFLKGKIAIANVKSIYQKFKEVFGERNFWGLKAKGAVLQRPLWASTSTKNPAYSDLIYVDNLIGPMTVNTMPHQTVLAFQDHGRIALTLESDLPGACAYLTQVEDIGISVEMICQEAQVEGVRAFQQSFDTLMSAIKKKAA